MPWAELQRQNTNCEHLLTKQKTQKRPISSSYEGVFQITYERAEHAPTLLVWMVSGLVSGRHMAVCTQRRVCTLYPGVADVGVSPEGTGRDVQYNSCTRCPSQSFLQSGENASDLNVKHQGMVWTIKTTEVVSRKNVSLHQGDTSWDKKQVFYSDRQMTGTQNGTPKWEHGGRCLLSNTEIILLDIYPREM